MERVVVQAEPILVERARHAARERGISLSQLVRDALEHELAREGSQPPLTCLGAFDSGARSRGARADADEYKPPRFR